MRLGGRRRGLRERRGRRLRLLMEGLALLILAELFIWGGSRREGEGQQEKEGLGVLQQ